MRRMIRTYRDVISILFAESPFVVVSVLMSGVLSGAIIALSVWVMYLPFTGLYVFTRHSLITTI